MGSRYMTIGVNLNALSVVSGRKPNQEEKRNIAQTAVREWMEV